MTDPVRSLVRVRVTVEVEIDGVPKEKIVADGSTTPTIPEIPEYVWVTYRLAADSCKRSVRAAFGRKEE